jgi:hypothetical protein
MIAGVGYVRDKANKINNKRMFNMWCQMLYRCYSTNNSNYRLYGEQGVSVCDRWHCFDYYVEDVKKIDGHRDDLFNNNKIVLDWNVQEKTV